MIAVENLIAVSSAVCEHAWARLML